MTNSRHSAVFALGPTPYPLCGGGACGCCWCPRACWGPHLSLKPLLCCLLYLREVLSIGAFLGRASRLGLLLQ